MRFYLRRKRQPPAVIIVALIDILIVLLIFLMVTTTFKQQPALKLSLPESSQALKSGATESPPLVLSIDEKGILFLGSDKRAMSFDTFKSELVAAVNKNPDLKLAINADERAPWGKIINVKDAARDAGVKDAVYAFTREPGKP
jgi:biopolymer transport protein ExbD